MARRRYLAWAAVLLLLAFPTAALAVTAAVGTVLLAVLSLAASHSAVTLTLAALLLVLRAMPAARRRAGSALTRKVSRRTRTAG